MSHEPPVPVPNELACALCRKKAPETVTKLCHACGLPLHVTCAQHLAARDCDLEFGFPLPAVFCSKRCYDADLLGEGSTGAGAGGGGGVPAAIGGGGEDGASTAVTNADLQSKRWSPHVPNEVTAALTLKIGDVTRTSRKHLSISAFRFLLTEGFEVFKAKVNSRTLKELQSYQGEPHVREDAAIYIRPGVHSKQSELVELTEKNFETRIRKTYRNFLKRKATHAALSGANERFECDIYTYVKKESAVRRRAGLNGAGIGVKSPSGINVRTLGGLNMQHGQAHHPLHLQPHGLHVDYSEGSAASTGAAMIQSMDSINGTTVGVKRRLGQLSGGDASVGTPIPGSDALSLAAGASGAAYKSIRMILNGSIVAVKVNVFDLLSALGLQQPSPLTVGEDGASPTGTAHSNTNGEASTTSDSMQC